ncbi:hypothetical protein PPH41_18645, partial [Burkholderia gladioli]|nr:hypothetical protein [Burkholderia gladioli]
MYIDGFSHPSTKLSRLGATNPVVVALPTAPQKQNPRLHQGTRGFSPSAARRREGRRHPGLLRAELLDQHIELGQF